MSNDDWNYVPERITNEQVRSMNRLLATPAKDGPSVTEWEPGSKEVRQAAICVIAAEACLWDEMDAERAVKWAKRLVAALNTEPWLNGKHSGDCTKEPHSCIRCQVEEAEAKARHLEELNDNPVPPPSTTPTP